MASAVAMSGSTSTGASGNSNAPETTLESIAPELKLKILSYLPHKALCRSVMPVNSDWLEQASHPSLWRDIDVTIGRSHEVTHVIRLLHRFPKVWRLRIRAQVVSRVASILDRLSASEKDGYLYDEVLGGGLFGHASDDMKELLKACRGLRSLSLDHFHLYHFPELLVPGANPDLKELHFARCLGVSPSVVSSITANFPQLELLEIDVMHYPDVGVRLIADFMKNLRALLVRGASEDALQYLAEKGPKLEAIGMEFQDTFSERTLLAYFAMPTMKFVHVFQVLSIPAENYSIPRCLKVGSVNGTLKGAEFCIGGLLDDAVMNDFTFQCPSLEWLSLAWLNTMSDGGVTALLRACANLRVLHVTGVRKTLTGEPWLSAIGDMCPQLKILSLSQTARFPHESEENLSPVLKTAATNNPKVVMVWNGDVLPPNDVRYASRSVDCCWRDLRVWSLDAFNKYDVPFVGSWRLDF